MKDLSQEDLGSIWKVRASFLVALRDLFFVYSLLACLLTLGRSLAGKRERGEREKKKKAEIAECNEAAY